MDHHIWAYGGLTTLPIPAPSSFFGAIVIRGRVLVAHFKLEDRSAIHPGLSVLVTGPTPNFAGVPYESNATIVHGRVVHVLAISRGAHTIATDCGRVPSGHKYVMVPPADSLNRSPYASFLRSAKPFTWREHFHDQDNPKTPQYSTEDIEAVRRRNELKDYPEYFVEPQAKTPSKYVYRPAILRSLILDQEYFPGSIYEYYNVMWVEWENGIAYRKGLARIAKDVFERECLGWMDVALG
ncbi:hypothetical protein B0A48_09259 [Cryoendolithus antarcticus]|uniref:Uncharacterized protein n=1 Tax=Cryoendolithus antarcticus TaxID=1507870 RepID=A0A1V8T2D5_9PEZI|nr:hypothetical protein B0A48_09259 [Cryoendolithus antarcticus]